MVYKEWEKRKEKKKKSLSYYVFLPTAEKCFKVISGFRICLIPFKYEISIYSSNPQWRDHLTKRPRQLEREMKRKDLSRKKGEIGFFFLRLVFLHIQLLCVC